MVIAKLLLRPSSLFLLEFQLLCAQHYTDSFYRILIISCILMNFYLATHLFISCYLLVLRSLDIIVTKSSFYYSSVTLTDLIYWLHVYIVWIIPFTGSFHVGAFLFVAYRFFMTFSFGNLEIFIDLICSHLLGLDLLEHYI